MDINKIHELFIKIKEITGFEDIVYHRFEDGGLCPTYKLETEHLKSQDWKNTHSKMSLKIEDVWVLKSVFNDKKTFYMYDTDSNPDAPEAFRVFNIKSILAIPVIKDSKVIGMVDIASLGKLLSLSEEQIKECERLTLENTKYFY